MGQALAGAVGFLAEFRSSPIAMAGPVLAEKLQDVRSLIDGMRLTFSRQQLDRVLQLCSSRETPTDSIVREMATLSQRIHDELASCCLLLLPAESIAL